jgi:hypothetical protein
VSPLPKNFFHDPAVIYQGNCPQDYQVFAEFGTKEKIEG